MLSSPLGRAILAHARSAAREPAIDTGANGAVGWAELAERVDRLAGLYRSWSEGPVAVTLDQGLDGLLVDLALLEAGVPALPLPPFFSAEQRAHAIAASGARALIAGKPEAPVMLAASAAAPALPPGTARISFTSGSTGAPKGVCLAADHLVAVAQAVVDHLGRSHAGRHLALLPPGILLETVAGFHASILAGGTYVALRRDEVGMAHPFRPDFAAMLAAIADHRITSLILVPELLGGLVGAMEATATRLPLLTLVAVGGARVPERLIARARALGLPVRQGYGLTECGSVVALETGDEPLAGSVGVSLGLNRLRLEADGEIVIEGPLFLGTIGAPRAPGALRTGDLGRIDARGRITILGRKGNMIITTHGRNIAPEWVEAALLDQAEIAQAMIHGEGQSSLGALLVPASPEADLATAVAAANATLPDYARVAHWRAVPPFTADNAMLTGNGRLRRAAIAQTYLEGAAMPFFDRLVAETAADRAALAAVPQLQAGLAGRIDRATYLAYLTQAYHHVRHTVPLMEEARSRLGHRPVLVAALDDYIEEETGHEAWILADIAAAGGDAAAAAASAPAPATEAMVAHAYRTIRTGNPAAFFGMVYVLEGTSVAMATQGAAAVRAALGLPDAAFTYLSSHGALDLDHMRFFEALMNRIDDGGDQQAILAMARDMFRLFGGMFAAIPIGALDAAA
jgi:long-subunit acyl-CoA synthetase (AMP-forming)/pyrroloquinoline quinone (PQQ) biosynthesis protein C